jgi:uncharacterized protein (TIGR02266 family)
MARRPPRVPLAVDVEYIFGGTSLRRRTRNIGAGGVFIQTPDPLPVGAPVRLRFSLPGQPAPLTVEAAVAWAEPLVGMGLRFTWLAPEDEAAIRRYVTGRLEDGEPLAGAGAPAAPAPSDADRQQPGERTLYLATTSDGLRTRLGTLLASQEMAHAWPYPELLAVPVTADLLERLRAELRGSFTRRELEGCKAALMPGRERPRLRDLLGMPSLAALLVEVDGELLARMLREDRLVSHFQPIVHAGSPEAVFGYEALVRGRAEDGTLVGPLELYAIGRAADLLFPLDRLARLSAVRGAAAHRLGTHLFINVNPGSLGEADGHLTATCQALAEAGLSIERTVFEIVESDRIDDVPRLLRIMDTYREAGFGVALDDLGAGYSSLALLTQLRPHFVKLDMALVRGIAADRYRAEIVARLLESARALDIRTVAEGVETEEEWRWFADHGVDFVQGFLFARPALPPPLPFVPGAPPAVS